MDDSLKISDPDFDLFELAFFAVQEAEAVLKRHSAAVRAHLMRLAAEKNLVFDDCSFNIGTRSFEIKPANPIPPPVSGIIDA